MDYQEYWTEVRDMAQQITAEAREHQRDIGDVLAETVDGHEFVIYTAKNFGVLTHCSNHDAYTEEHGVDDVCKDGEVNWAALAYAAFSEDIRAHSEFDAENADPGEPFPAS